MVRSLFAVASLYQPSIIFIDEVGEGAHILVFYNMFLSLSPFKLIISNWLFIIFFIFFIPCVFSFYPADWFPPYRPHRKWQRKLKKDQSLYCFRTKIDTSNDLCGFLLAPSPLVWSCFPSRVVFFFLCFIIIHFYSPFSYPLLTKFLY